MIIFNWLSTTTNNSHPYICVMTIQYASDLHLEFPENEAELWNNNLKPCADILILAGDIVPFKKIDEQAWFFDYVSANFKTTCWVPGNHEYYHYDLAARQQAQKCYQ